MRFDTHKQRTASVAWNSELAYARRQWNNWVYRMQTEIAFAARTWFVTLTFNRRSLYRVHEIAKNRYIGFDKTFSQMQYLPIDFNNAVEGVARERLRNYLRVLKNRVTFRYVAACEYGSVHGRIHFHLLLHFESEIPYRTLDCWDHGFTKFNIVKDNSKASYYVAKYITKQKGRILCSLKYGLKAIQLLQSKPKYQLMLMTNPKRLYKLMMRISKASRYPTMSYLRRSMELSTPSTPPLQRTIPLRTSL